MAQQIWISKDDQSIVKYVVKAPQGTFCMPVSMFQSNNKNNQITPKSETPEEYKPESLGNYKIGTFTTESGKTVKVVIVEKNGDETWLSSEVPYGLVKVVKDGNAIMVLKDFGSGSSLEISKSERDNCQTVPFA